MGPEEANPKRTLPSGADDKFRRLLEAAPDALLLVDPSGRIQLCNSRSETIFGYSKAELLGQPVEILHS